MIKSAARKMDMTEGSVFGKVLIYALPVVATGMLQVLYNAADTVIVGRYASDGETALAAVGSCGALINLIIQLFMGLSVGAGVLVAQQIGARQFEDVKKTVHTAVPAATILGIIVAIFGYISAGTLLSWTGVEKSVLSEAVPYMRAYMCGIPASMVYNYCAAMMRSSGDTSRPLMFLSISGVVNIILNIITVVIFDMGALGVGVATAVSNWLSMALIVGYMMRDKGIVHLELREIKICWDKLGHIIRIGIPAGIQGCIFAFSNVLVQSSVNSFGKIATAGNAAAANIDSFVYTAMNSFYHATLTFVGQNVGAKKYHRIKKIIVTCALIVFVVGVAMGGTIYIFGRQLVGIYAPGNEAVISAALRRTAVVTTTYFMCGLMEVACGAMRGMGSSFIPMIVSIVGTFSIRVGWIYTVFAAYPTVTVLYLSYPVSWIVTATAHYICCAVYLRHIKKKNDSISGPLPKPKFAGVDC